MNFLEKIMTKWMLVIVFAFFANLSHSEPISHDKYYPSSEKPAHAIILLHSSGGYKSVAKKVQVYTDAGYVVYTPDFFQRHGITTATRFQSWTTYRTNIEIELNEVIQLMKADVRIDASNIFAVGFSNGGYWAAFLAATGVVNAGISHYGVWDFPGNYYGYPVKYFRDSSNPVLALIGKDDKTQRYERVMPQVQMAEKLSPRVVKKIYNASHAWDCAPCNSEYIYNEVTTMDALKSTIDFMKENSK